MKRAAWMRGARGQKVTVAIAAVTLGLLGAGLAIAGGATDGLTNSDLPRILSERPVETASASTETTATQDATRTPETSPSKEQPVVSEGTGVPSPGPTTAETPADRDPSKPSKGDKKRPTGDGASSGEEDDDDHETVAPPVRDEDDDEHDGDGSREGGGDD